VFVWRRFDLASARPGRVVLIAVGSGFLGAFALYAAVALQPPVGQPSAIVMLSDALLLFPLLLLSNGLADQATLSLLAPVLLGVELSIVLICVMLAARWMSRAFGQRA
jgi:hypothetical protein